MNVIYCIRPLWLSSLVERTVKADSTGKVRTSFDFSPPPPHICSPFFTLLVQTKLYEPASPLSVCWVCLIMHITAQEAAKRHLRDWYKTSIPLFIDRCVITCDSPCDASSTSHRLVTCKSIIPTQRGRISVPRTRITVMMLSRGVRAGACL